jgi:uncharacterized protein (TIGR02466 family)
MNNTDSTLKFQNKEHFLFSTPVFESTVQGVDNAGIASYSRMLREKTQGVTISNRGGWHSKEVLNPLPENLVEFFNTLEKFVAEYIGTFTSVNSLKLGNFWININGPNDYNLVHDHQNSILSGVYYVEVPEGDSGNLIIERDDTAEFFLGRYKGSGPFYTLEHSFIPEAGKLILFPAWTKHRVERNNTSKERISIAFNFVDEEKIKEGDNKAVTPAPKREENSWGQW